MSAVSIPVSHISQSRCQQQPPEDYTHNFMRYHEPQLLFSTVSKCVSVSALKLISPFGVLQNTTEEFLISIHLFNPLLSTDKFFGLGSFL